MMRTKKFLAILLSVLMLISALPVNALAATISAEVKGAKFWTVEFQDINGNKLVRQLVQNGESALEPNIPDVEGKKFVCWTVNGVERGLSNITGNTVFRAAYETLGKVRVTIRYEYSNNGGEAAQAHIVEFNAGSPVSLNVPNPVLEGFKSYVDGVEKASFTFSSPSLTENKEFTVYYGGGDTYYTVKHWQQNVGDNGYTLKESSTVGGVKVGTLTNVSAKNYAGFTPQVFYQANVKSGGTTVINIYYDRNYYTLSVDTVGGTYVPGATLRYGAAMSSLSAAPTRLGFAFKGWKDAANKTYTANSTMPAGNVTVKAQWQENEYADYTVIYYQQSTSDRYNASSKTYDYVRSEVKNGKVGTAPSYTNVASSAFNVGGSYYGFSSSAIIEVNNGGKIKSDGTTVVTIKHNRRTVTLNFTDRNGKRTTLKGLYGQTFSAAGVSWPMASDGSYRWRVKKADGSNTNRYIVGMNSFTRLDITEVTASNQGNFDGRFVIDFGYRDAGSLKVYYMVQSLGSNGKPNGKYHEEMLGTCGGGNWVFSDKLQGHVLDYYTDSRVQTSAKSVKAGDSYNQKGHLYIYHERLKYEIHFENTGNANDKSVVYFEAPYKTGTKGTFTNPSRPAHVDPEYVFEGWYTSSDYTTRVNWNTLMPYHNIQVFARWVPPTKTVIWDYNDDNNARGATADKKVTVTKGTTIPANQKPATPTTYKDARGGEYRFDGWYVDKALTQPFVDTITITQNITVYAKWTLVAPLNYKFVYRTEDGKAIPAEDLAGLTAAQKGGTGRLGDVVSMNPVPTLPGYTAVTTSVKETLTEDGQEIIIRYKKLDTWKLTLEYRIADGYADYQAQYGSTFAGYKTITAETADQLVVIYKYIQIGNQRFRLADGEAYRRIIERPASGQHTEVFRYVPIVQVPYVIEYYLEQEDGSYVEKTDAEVRKMGELHDTTAPITAAEKKTFVGWTLDAGNAREVLSATIVANQTVALKLYYKLDRIDIPVKKIWADAGDQDGRRPDSITIQLLANGSTCKTAVLSGAGDEWSYTFTRLPEYANGSRIRYTIQEVAVQPYQSTISGYTVTNSYTPETITVQGAKTWRDDANSFAARPASITIHLLADDKKIDSRIVTAANGWAYSFTGLPKYRDHGTEIIYTITEDPVNGYTTDISGFNVTNTIFNPVVRIEKSATNVPEDEHYDIGDTITYKLVVFNDGNVDLINVVVEDDLTGYRTTIASLPVGASVVLEGEGLSYQVKEADALEGDIVNVATAKTVATNPDTGEEIPTEDDDTETVKTEMKPDIDIIKNVISTPANNEAYMVGEVIRYEIIVRNTGDVTLSNVVVKDALLNFETTIETLAVGEEVRLSEGLELTVTEAHVLSGDIRNVATAEGSVKDPYTGEEIPTDDEDDEIVETDFVVGIETIKNVISTPPEGDAYTVGDLVEYEILVKNTGDVTLWNVVVKDELLDWETTIASLAPGEQIRFTEGLTLIVSEAQALAGAIANVATATADPVKDPDEEDPIVPEDDDTEEIPTTYTPGLDIVKTTTSTPSHERGYMVDEIISYEIVVSNTGNVTLHDVIVEDELTGDSWIIEVLPVGEEGVVSFETSYVTTRADVDAGHVLNVATARAKDPGDPDNPDKDLIETDDADDPTRPIYRLTIRYWYENIGGEVAHPTFSREYYHGEGYNVVSPQIPGYTVDIERVVGVITGDVVYDVIYRPIEYKLTIYYIFQDGSTAFPTYSDTLRKGEAYYVPSPQLEGYVASLDLVEGVMPGRDLVYTVIYVPEDQVITIDEYGMPLGLGNVEMNVGDCFE